MSDSASVHGRGDTLARSDIPLGARRMFGLKDVFTSMNALSGVFGVYFVIKGHPLWGSYSFLAGYAADVFDGRPQSDEEAGERMRDRGVSPVEGGACGGEDVVRVHVGVVEAARVYFEVGTRIGDGGIGGFVVEADDGDDRARFGSAAGGEQIGGAEREDDEGGGGAS